MTRGGEGVERVTGALELLGILLVVLAAGWQVAALAGVPLGLFSSAVAAWLASWLLQGAHLPGAHRLDPRRNAR